MPGIPTSMSCRFTSAIRSGSTVLGAAGLALLMAATGAAAQTSPQTSPPGAQEGAGRPGCGAPQRESATPKASGPDAGTAPGGSGSTGWSGGTGGSFVGTTPQGATPGSPTEHPETVQGLDPKPGPSTPC